MYTSLWKVREQYISGKQCVLNIYALSENLIFAYVLRYLLYDFCG